MKESIGYRYCQARESGLWRSLPIQGEVQELPATTGGLANGVLNQSGQATKGTRGMSWH
jgi:hypothetical protein